MVSIIVPAYNEAEYHQDALQSIDDHHGSVPCEILVVDGGCTDSNQGLPRDQGSGAKRTVSPCTADEPGSGSCTW